MTVESSDSKMLILSAGRKAVVVSVIEKGVDEELVTRKMESIASAVRQG